MLYLHNVAESQLEALGPPKFLQRLKDAFTWLEEARKQGRIQAYGMVSICIAPF